MKILDEKYWVKPFGTGMTCIDTVDGECLRGLTVDECINTCEESPYCNAGYHVSFDDLPLASYCLPLNTIYYQNTNFLTNVIPPNNKTRLSRDNGVHTTVFYNEKRFPDDVDLFQTPYMFVGDTCYWCQDRGKQGIWFLQADFTFTKSQETAIRITLGEETNEIFDFDLRISKRSRLTLFKENEFNLLTFTSSNQSWKWGPYQRYHRTYQCVDVDTTGPFVNYGDRFFLQSHFKNTKEYLTTAYSVDTQRWNMTLTSHRPKDPFFFILDKENRVNRVTRQMWYERPTSTLTLRFSETMESFLCDNFMACTKRESIPLEKKWTRPLTLLLWALIVVMIMVVMSFVVRDMTR